MFHEEGGETAELLPGEGVDAPSLKPFKVKLDRALKCLNLLKMFLLFEGGLDLIFKDLFQTIL